MSTPSSPELEPSTHQPSEPWLDERVVPVLFVALAATLPALLLAGPVSSAWELVVAVVALVVCRRRIGGGRAGAVAGALVGAIVAAPAALPPLAILAFEPFTQGPEVPATGALRMGELMIRSLSSLGLAAVAATMILPLVFAWIGWSAPRRSNPRATRLNRLIPHFLLLLLLPVAVAEFSALFFLTTQILAFLANPQRAPWQAGVGYVVTVAALLVVRVATLLACWRAIRRGAKIPADELAPAPVWASLGMFSLLFPAAVLPGIAFGLAAGLGTVSGIPSWQDGGTISTADLERLYFLLPMTQATYVLYVPLLGGLVLGLMRGGGWLIRRFAPRGPGAGGPSPS